jgi:hypothetical protein
MGPRSMVSSPVCSRSPSNAQGFFWPSAHSWQFPTQMVTDVSPRVARPASQAGNSIPRQPICIRCLAISWASSIRSLQANSLLLSFSVRNPAPKACFTATAIAPVGQAAIHSPHSVHRSFTLNPSLPIVSAPSGHASLHRVQEDRRLRMRRQRSNSNRNAFSCPIIRRTSPAGFSTIAVKPSLEPWLSSS